MADRLIEIYDELGTIRDLVEAAYMASADLVKEQAGPMQALLNITSERLKGAMGGLEEFRQRNRKETANV